MTRKISFCTFALTMLLLSGCTRNNAPNSNDTANMISEEKAIEIALAHAGVTADQTIFIRSEIDRDNGRTNYDVEFCTADHREYDYEIDSYNGEVLDFDYDAENYTLPSISPEADSISLEDAKEIVLAQIPGSTEQDIQEIKSDYDNGGLQYEGKIYYEQMKYEFEIDGYDGSILEWDVVSNY